MQTSWTNLLDVGSDFARLLKIDRFGRVLFNFIFNCGELIIRLFRVQTKYFQRRESEQVAVNWCSKVIRNYFASRHRFFRFSISFVSQWMKNRGKYALSALRGRENSDCFIIKEQLKMLFGKCLHISPEEICSASASGRNQYFNCYSDVSCDLIHRWLNEKVIFDPLEWNLCGKFVILMRVFAGIDAIWNKFG